MPDTGAQKGARAMETCSNCRYWRHDYLDTSEAGWRTKMLIEAGFGGCVLFEDEIKRNFIGDPDIAAQTKDGAFILGDFATLITHSAFGCNRWRVKLGRKPKSTKARVANA